MRKQGKGRNGPENKQINDQAQLLLNSLQIKFQTNPCVHIVEGNCYLFWFQIPKALYLGAPTRKMTILLSEDKHLHKPNIFQLCGLKRDTNALKVEATLRPTSLKLFVRKCVIFYPVQPAGSRVKCREEVSLNFKFSCFHSFLYNPNFAWMRVNVLFRDALLSLDCIAMDHLRSKPTFQGTAAP